ncbi:MAG: hypothetical protein ACE5EK_05440, partial [Nitrospinales bacterium]
HHGLKKITARIQWKQLDVLSETGKYLAKPDLTFYWDSSSRRNFRISNDSLVTSDKRQELLNLLGNYNELVIPLTLEERFAGFKGIIKKKQENWVHVDFQSMKPSDPVRMFSLLIDVEKWVISKLQIYQNNDPKRIRATLKYIPKDEQWLLFESTSRFNLDKDSYVETTRYFYDRVRSFWLVKKVEQTVKRNDETVQGYIFRMDQYRMND